MRLQGDVGVWQVYVMKACMSVRAYECVYVCLRVPSSIPCAPSLPLPRSNGLCYAYQEAQVCARA